MSALLKKEIRLLLPNFSIGLLLTLSLRLIPQYPDSASGTTFVLAVTPFLVCPALAVILALDSFGREFSTGTFTGLLSQPLARTQIWRAKTASLAVALAILLGAWWLSFLAHAKFEFLNQTLPEFQITTSLILITAFSGGLWSVLLLRQVAAAFWFTVLIPAALAVFTMYLTGKLFGGSGTEYTISVVLVAYSIAGFIWARRMFLRAQDVQWTGGDITMPDWLRLKRSVVSTENTSSRQPRLALLAKEFQLHQSQFVIAGALLVLHLGMIAARKMSGGFKDSPMLEFITDQFWVLWFVMPLLIGCASVAEERKLGILEAQLCLTARQRTQFTIKFVVVLFLSVVFAVVLPMVIEGRKLFPQMLWPLFAIVTGSTTISFYASTFARNTLQALAPAVLSILVAFFLVIGGPVPETVFNYPLWRGWLIYLIGVPVFAAVLISLSYANFNGWTMWRHNALVLLGSLLAVVTLTCALYQRSWELMSPIESPHGGAQLTKTRDVKVWSDVGQLMVQLADGRIWSARFDDRTPSLVATLTGDRRKYQLRSRGTFLEGTTWSSFAICDGWEAVGIKSDGSLWVSAQPAKPMMIPHKGQAVLPEPAKLLSFGDDNDWKAVARENYTAVTLLKKDGTLWRLGTNQFDWKKPWPGLRAFELQRLGADSDWEQLYSSDSQPFGSMTFFRKSNGQSWRFVSMPSNAKGNSNTNVIQIDQSTFIIPAEFELFAIDGDVRASFQKSTFPGDCLVGVRRDGTFRVTAVWQLSTKHSPFPSWTMVQQDTQIGNETNWIAVTGNGETVITLKADGSLWQWSFHDNPATNPNAGSCARLGNYSAWVAINNVMGNDIVSLAADGSLWCWQFEPANLYARNRGSIAFGPWQLLRVSRKPQQIANIFDTAK